MNRKQIIEEFIKNIHRLSDEKYQERVWVRAEGPECNEIDDTVCDFLDDGSPILRKHEEFRITEVQYKMLTKLYDKLREFTDTYEVYSAEKSTERLINLPQWHEIRDISKKILQAFNFK